MIKATLMLPFFFTDCVSHRYLQIIYPLAEELLDSPRIDHKNCSLSFFTEN